MQITGPEIVAIASIVMGLIFVHLALSGRLERILRASLRYARASRRSIEPLRLTDFKKDSEIETRDSVKKRE